VRFGFRLLYQEMAFCYDGVAMAVSLGDWWAWGRAGLNFLPPPSAGPVLELAFGTGHLQTRLHAAGYAAFGGDLSPQMARITYQRLRRAGHPPQLCRMQAQALPFPSATFCAALSTFPTDYILDPLSLAETWRVLQAGGRLIIVPSAVLTWGGPLKQAIEGAYQVTGQREAWGGEAALRAAGFRVEIYEQTLDRSRVSVVVAHKDQAV
jgi:ubiquinone/menaquinone biosynthesis C-methylase UbiE